MGATARFLHITDTHLKTAGTELKVDDFKVRVPGIDPATRESAIAETLKRVATALHDSNQTLDGVIFCGDAQVGGQAGGHQLLFELLMEHLEKLGIAANKIIAVPGNHDVPRGSPPGSVGRYQAFTDVWRKGGCITPWLDGVDTAHDWRKHVLLSSDFQWAIVAFNSCNWSHVDALPSELRKIWDAIPGKFAGGDDGLEKKLREGLDHLSRYDMARVSPQQLGALKAMLRDLPRPNGLPQVRIAALHHHLRAPSHREEVKPFADVTNLEQVRTFLQEQDFSALLHGHKHESKVQYDHVHAGDDKSPHRILMVAGATFEAGRANDAVRVVDLDGLPWIPSLRLTAFPVARQGLDAHSQTTKKYRLWTPLEPVDAPPVVIQGSDIDEVYARLRLLAEEEAKNKTLIVHLDLRDTSTIKRLPKDYPALLDGEKARADWLDDLVKWWQLPSSQLDQRIHYIHGNRLRRYGSDVDQITRIGDLLRQGATTRAIAVLIDPSRDFREDTRRRDFASFCLVQFIRRDGPGHIRHVDCVAFYRAQEMVRWWPINVAELLHLQHEIGSYFNATPGRITTITADARSTARSPTRVAMPVIDRWLDQAPEKLHVLALSLVRGALESDLERSIANEWLAALKDLQLAAHDHEADGGPVVAIEGLRVLAQYLEASHGPGTQACTSLATNLRELANLGGDERRAGAPKERQDWSKRVVDSLQGVAAECERIWSSKATVTKRSPTTKTAGLPASKRSSRGSSV